MKNDNFDFLIYTDGGARGNPGEAAYGFVIYDTHMNLVKKEGKRIGIATNNVAEYMGVISSLRWVLENLSIQNSLIQVFLDSQLVASQLKGTFKVKNESLRSLFFTVKNLERKLNARINYIFIKREQNKEADQLVNLALDQKI